MELESKGKTIHVISHFKHFFKLYGNLPVQVVISSPESSSATTESLTPHTARLWLGILPVEREMLDYRSSLILHCRSVVLCMHIMLLHTICQAIAIMLPCDWIETSDITSWQHFATSLYLPSSNPSALLLLDMNQNSRSDWVNDPHSHCPQDLQLCCCCIKKGLFSCFIETHYSLSIQTETFQGQVLHLWRTLLIFGALLCWTVCWRCRWLHLFSYWNMQRKGQTCKLLKVAPVNSLNGSL